MWRLFMKRSLLLSAFLLVLLQMSSYADLRYLIEPFNEVGFGTYMSFDMNDNGSIVYIAADDNDNQVFLYKNGVTTQLTNNNQQFLTGIYYLKLNNNDQAVWVQDDWDETLTLLNQNVYTASPTLEQTRVNGFLADWGNICAFPWINDHGHIVWQQVIEGLDWDIYLFRNGNVIPVTQTDATENHPRINNSGYVVFEGWNPPENDWLPKIYLWDGNEKKVIAINDPYPCENPFIDNDNNIVYSTSFDGSEGTVLKMYSIEEDQTYNIDVPVVSKEFMSNFGSNCARDSKVLMTGLDNQIYKFTKNGGVEQLTTDGEHNSPAFIGNIMAWIKTHPRDEYVGIVEVMIDNATYIIEDAFAGTGLKIDKQGRIIFARIGIASLPLLTAELQDVYDVSGDIMYYTSAINKKDDNISSEKGLEGVEVTNGKQTTYTDADGRFVLKNLRTGNHRLTFMKVEYSFDPPFVDINISNEHIVLSSEIKAEKLSSVSEHNEYIKNIFLSPNPSFDNLLIELKLNKSAKISMDIYNINGKLIKNIVKDQFYIAGTSFVNVNTTDLTPSVYILAMIIDGKYFYKSFYKQLF